MTDKISSENGKPEDAGSPSDEWRHIPGERPPDAGVDPGTMRGEEAADPSADTRGSPAGPSSAAEMAEQPAVEDREDEAPSGEESGEPDRSGTSTDTTVAPPSEQELREILAELDEELGLEEPPEEELTSLREELESTRDRHLRLAADFDNYRRRADRQRRESWILAQAEFLGQLLDALDDLQRVGDYDPATSTVEALHEGVALVERKIFKAITEMGAEVVDPAGEVFDPAVMEAMATVPAESEDDDDKVSEVFQKGYVFKGQLVRPARVIVRQYE
jgi:molecular chaperone GrpE